MKKQRLFGLAVVWMLVWSLNYHLNAQVPFAEWGVTHFPLNPTNYRIVEGPLAKASGPLQLKPNTSLQKPFLLKPDGAFTPLELVVPAQNVAVITINPQMNTVELPEEQPRFSEHVESAIARAPAWVRKDLRLIFQRLNAESQNKWAELLNGCEHRLVDEIAFCIAHLGPDYLNASFAYPELLELNARLIYEYDRDLQYVQVIDYDDEPNENFYTTVRYKYLRLIDTLQVEIPPEVYYWYIVHPRLSDEIPAFIDPDVVEDNYSHRNNIVGPNRGFFWRDYLYRYADPGYYPLKKMLKKATLLITKATHFKANAQTDAIGVLNRWLDASMTFTSDAERPHQPVRIYKKHIGRCGENSDMRLAIGRLALIPVVPVASISTDHVWNEFWLERWIHWDGEVDNPKMYEKGWGKKFGSVFQERSDGRLFSVTDRYYSETCQLTINVTDENGLPLDGVRVFLFTTGLYSDVAFDNYDVTDATGKVHFVIGADRTYYVQIISKYGRIPAQAEEVQVIIGNALKDIHYQKTFELPVKQVSREAQALALQPTDSPAAMVRLDLTVKKQALYAADVFNDLEGVNHQFLLADSGKLTAYLVDAENLNKILQGEPFQYWAFFSQVNDLNAEINLPDLQTRYLVFDNALCQSSNQFVQGSVEIFLQRFPGISKVELEPGFPNPVKIGQQKVTFNYQLPQKSTVEVAIYNVLGQKVRTLEKGVKWAGPHQVVWDGKDQQAKPLSSGVYYCAIRSHLGQSVKPIVIVK